MTSRAHLEVSEKKEGKEIREDNKGGRGRKGQEGDAAARPLAITIQRAALLSPRLVLLTLSNTDDRNDGGSLREAESKVSLYVAAFLSFFSLFTILYYLCSCTKREGGERTQQDIALV